MLTLEFELLTHVYRATLPDGSGPEWPPHPDRVFSALVQAWGDGGEQEAERQALEWLEALDEPPVVEASPEWFARDLADVYVPPNDARNGQLALLPEKRPRQARSFSACFPEHPTIRFQWEASPPSAHEEALRRLVHRVASLGHSSSLVRCSVAGEVLLTPERTWRPDEDGFHSLRSVYPGRLADLVRWFQTGRRPLSRSTLRYAAPDEEASGLAPSSVFGRPRDWFVFEGASGDSPDILGLAHLAQRFRHALMSLAPQPPLETLSGHAPDGGPSQRPHAAVVPLIDVGWDHSRGGLLGLALVLPRDIDGVERDAVLHALARFARIDEVDEDLDYPAVLNFARFQWSLRRIALPGRASLRPGRWCGTGTTWASGTPIVLDRFADGDDPAEEAACIARSCRDVGLPEPICIEIHKYSALRGAPEAYPARGVAYRPSWSFPEASRLAHRPRRHVCLRFAGPIAGPVILGAGRYQGFGLCLPLAESRIG